jgi:transposase-like protein
VFGSLSSCKGSCDEVKSRRKYDDLKTETLRIRIALQINSGKNVKEISETFDIPENVLYRWKTNQNIKTKTKTSDDQSNFTLKLIAENEFLKKDNNRLQTERDILKKVSAGVPVTLFSMSS